MECWKKWNSNIPFFMNEKFGIACIFCVVFKIIHYLLEFFLFELS